MVSQSARPVNQPPSKENERQRKELERRKLEARKAKEAKALAEKQKRERIEKEAKEKERRKKNNPLTKAMNSAASSIGRELGTKLIRGLLNTFLR